MKIVGKGQMWSGWEKDENKCGKDDMRKMEWMKKMMKIVKRNNLSGVHEKIWEWGKDKNGVGEKGMKTNVETWWWKWNGWTNNGKCEKGQGKWKGGDKDENGEEG